MSNYEISLIKTKIKSKNSLKINEFLRFSFFKKNRYFIFNSLFFVLNPIYRLDDYPKLLEQLGSSEAVSQLIGVKSTTLGQIQQLNIKVPPGVVLSTEAYKQFIENKSEDLPDDLWEDILQSIKPIEEDYKMKYGSPKNPILFSVRGDSPNYMVGMLGTVSNVGLNDLTARAMERNTKNRAFVWDCYRRLVQDYGVVVLHIPISQFDDALLQFRNSRNLNSFNSFSELDYIDLTKINKSIIVKNSGKPFPQDPFEQLRKIICAIFSSLSTERVKNFKQKLNIKDENQMSVLLMPMIYGNKNITTSSSILCTRNLVTGTSELIGEYATNATCSDITLSQRTSHPLEDLQTDKKEFYNKITVIGKTLERHFKKPQIIDFVYENGEIFLLQSSNAQLTTTGRFQAAKDMVEGGIITKEESLCNFEPDDILDLIAPRLTAENPPAPFCQGIPAGNGCVVGKICLTNESAIELAKKGESAILVKKFLTNCDYDAIMNSSAVVTTIGNNTSFAAAIARLFRKTAALGCDKLTIDLEQQEIKCGDVTLKEGDEITVTGNGVVISGAQELTTPDSHSNESAKTVLSWADEIRKGKLFVYTKATTSEDVKSAAEIGSDGVGCFSLEQFFEGDDRRFILDLIDATNEDALTSFENHLLTKLKEVFAAAPNKTITIRLFDPNLNSYVENPMELAKEIGNLQAQKERDGDSFSAQDELNSKIEELENIKKSKVFNTNIGSRSVHLLIERPELMQAELRAILKASKEGRDTSSDNDEVLTRITLPYVSDACELDYIGKKVEEVSGEIGEKAAVGIEADVVRACLTTNKLTEYAAFINFSLPQLTESTFSIDRKESELQLLPFYTEKKYIPGDIFQTVPESVAELLKLGIDESKQTKADSEIGFFSDNFTDPTVVAHYTNLGINSFICNARAVPLVRLCAAKSLISKA